MALQNKSIIYCEHSDGRKTHFDRKSFLKLKMNKDGSRSGWKPVSGEVTGSDISEMSNDSNVPDILKSVRPQGKGVSEEEVQRRIDSALEKERAKQRRESSDANGNESLKVNPDNTVNQFQKKVDQLEDVKDRTAKGKPDEPQKRANFGKK